MMNSQFSRPVSAAWRKDQNMNVISPQCVRGVKYSGATRECEQPHTCGRVSVCETAFGISFIMIAGQAGQ